MSPLGSFRGVASDIVLARARLQRAGQPMFEMTLLAINPAGHVCAGSQDGDNSITI